MQGRGLGEPVEQHFVSMGMLQSKLKIAVAGLREGMGGIHCGEEFGSRLQAHRAENIVAVVVTLVDRGRGGAGRFGDAAHGEGFFAAPCPEPACGIQDALFELRICLSGQRCASVRFKDLLQGPGRDAV